MHVPPDQPRQFRLGDRSGLPAQHRIDETVEIALVGRQRTESVECVSWSISCPA